MNRKERRRLTQGDKKQVQNNLKEINQRAKNFEYQAQQQMAMMDQHINQRAKEIVALVLKNEFMPIVRDVLGLDLKVDEERIAKFEECFEKRKDTRLEKIDELRQEIEEQKKKLLEDTNVEEDQDKKEYHKPTIEQVEETSEETN